MKLYTIAMPRATKIVKTDILDVADTMPPVQAEVPVPLVSARKRAPKENVSGDTPALSKRSVKKTSPKERVESINIGVNTLMAKKPVPSNFVSPREVAVRVSTSLALLSPFRFPVDQQHLLTQTARYAGVFFVIVGAIFALYHTPALQPLGAGEYLASVTTSGTTTPGTISTLLNPDVTFDVNGGRPLKGTVKVTYRVLGATAITGQAYYKDGDTSIVNIGNPIKVNDDTWILEWNTTLHPDGQYKLRAIVQGNGTQYEDIDTTYIAIQNIPAPQTNTTTTSTSSAGTTGTTPTTTTQVLNTVSGATSTVSSTTVALVPKVILKSVAASPVKGNVKLITTLQGLTLGDVKIYAVNKDTDKNYFLGNAITRSNTELAYDWDTSAYPNGTYKLYSSLSQSNNAYSSEPISLIVKNVVATTTAATGVTSASTTTTDTQPVVQKPIISIPEQSPISGDTDILVTAKNADYVEIYILGSATSFEKLIGNASRRDIENWRLNWDTKTFTNGEFKVFARAKTSAGFTESSSVSIKIFNEVKTVLDGTEQKAIEIAKQAGEDVKVIEQNLTLTSVQIPERNEDASTTVKDLPKDERVLVKTNDFLGEYRDELMKDLELLSVAIRSGEESNVKLAERRIQDLRQRILDAAIGKEDTKDIVAEIDVKLGEALELYQKQVHRNEEIIKERVGDKVFTDSDKDGISDYDEVNIYATNPFGADSDGDGFNDGTEILGGYDPKNDVAETTVQFESPREIGLVREDILSIDSIMALTPDESDAFTDGVKPQALVEGKGLPNSFVTLYVFSSPVIVTIKTDDDGSWKYNFDKELEDGDHEIYVAVTDNAGRIVAKSNPFKFVKEASAFTPADAATVASVPPVTQEEPRVFGENILLFVFSFAVVMIGLVLLLLGFHMKNRKDIIPKMS